MPEQRTSSVKRAPAPSVSRLVGTTFEVRPLRSHQEYVACVELQKATWGETFAELVPPTLLQVSQRIGGVAAGAFGEDGRLLGFVFGITGVRGGRLVHWSDMLAVREEARGLGIGQRLKEFQREVVLGLGVEIIFWTFDPLVARNAHLNLNRLGARVVEYVPDMYGNTDSELHRGLGTDRFVVAWRIAGGEANKPSPAPLPDGWNAPLVNCSGEDGGPGLPDESALDAFPLIRIQIPADIYRVRALSPEAAARWRSTTRAAFLRSVERGYVVVGFFRDENAGRGFYVLSNTEHPQGGS